MSQSEQPKPPATTPRKQTPRIPSNIFYDRVLPIVLVAMGVILLVVVVIALAGLIGALR